MRFHGKCGLIRDGGDVGLSGNLVRNRYRLCGNGSRGRFFGDVCSRNRFLGGNLLGCDILGLVGDIALRGEPATGFGAGSPWLGLAAVAAMVCAVVAVSWLTWRFVEMPALAWFRRLAKRA